MLEHQQHEKQQQQQIMSLTAKLEVLETSAAKYDAELRGLGDEISTIRRESELRRVRIQELTASVDELEV